MLKSHPPAPSFDPDNPDVYFPLGDEQRAAITREATSIPGPIGEPDVRVVVTRPRGLDGPLPPLVHAHGGGFNALSPESFAGLEAYWASEFECVVVSVDYRLAPDHPFPAAPEDCYAALVWVANAEPELDIDPHRIVVTGGSAGGALAAALCMMTRDRGGPPITFQALQIPCLDDRMEQPSYAQATEDTGFLNHDRVSDIWIDYLGAGYDRSATSPYAAPLRSTDLSGLPPAYIQTSGLDPLRDEGIQYAMRLMAEGVDVELYCAPRNHHGIPIDDVGIRTALVAERTYTEALATVLTGQN